MPAVRGMKNELNDRGSAALCEKVELASIAVEPSIEESMLRAAVNALAESPLRPLANEVRVEVLDDTVYLTGKLNTFYFKQMAGETIRKDCSNFGFRIENAIEVS